MHLLFGSHRQYPKQEISSRLYIDIGRWIDINKDIDRYKNLYDLSQYCEQIKQRFFNQGYKSELINRCIKTVEKWNRKELLKVKGYHLKRKIPLVLTDNWLLPNFSNVSSKHWNMEIDQIAALHFTLFHSQTFCCFFKLSVYATTK